MVEAIRNTPFRARLNWLAAFYSLGALLSLYLVFLSFGKTDIGFCQLFGTECEQVVNSEFASIMGFSAASIGFSYFICQILIFWATFRGVGLWKQTILFTALLNVAAMGGSCWFLYLLFRVMEQSCAACLGVHLINFTTLILNVVCLVKMRGRTVAEPDGMSRKNDQKNIWVGSLLVSMVIFLAINLAESRHAFLLQSEKVANNLNYALFLHSQAVKVGFSPKKGDAVIGNPDKAIHQIVLIYKDGCRHCLEAKEKLARIVTRYPAAVYLILKNQKDFSREVLKKMEVEQVPAVFLNGRKADGWEIPGFLEKFTEDCGC